MVGDMRVFLNHGSRKGMPWIRLLLTSVVFLLFIGECFFDSPRSAYEIIIDVAIGNLFLALPFSPAIVTVCLIVLDAIVAFSVDGSVATFTTPVILGLGLTAYQYGFIISMAVFGLGALDRIAQMTVLGLLSVTVGTSFSILICFAFSVSCGLAIRWKERETQIRERSERMRHDEDTAIRIHDAVTGDLSLIARLAQSRLKSGSDDAQDWRKINTWAIECLKHTHEVIDQLYGKSEQQHGCMEGDEERIQQLLRTNDAKLRGIGFQGRSVMQTSGDYRELNHGQVELCEDLIGEVYANISRHARRDRPYEVSVTWTGDGVEITQVNDLRDDDGTIPSHGLGLDHYRSQIEKRGGRLITEVEDDKWLMFAHIR